VRCAPLTCGLGPSGPPPSKAAVMATTSLSICRTLGNASAATQEGSTSGQAVLEAWSGDGQGGPQSRNGRTTTAGSPLVHWYGVACAACVQLRDPHFPEPLPWPQASPACSGLLRLNRHCTVSRSRLRRDGNCSPSGYALRGTHARRRQARTRTGVLLSRACTRLRSCATGRLGSAARNGHTQSLLSCLARARAAMRRRQRRRVSRVHSTTRSFTS
jgi:hypothetical protein